MPNKPQPGDSIMVHIPGHKRAVEYIVVDMRTPLPDMVKAARPSRKHPGDFSSGFHNILLEWIV